MGGGDGGGTLVWALETESGVDCFVAPGGGAGRRRGAPLGALLLPGTAELMSVDMALDQCVCNNAHVSALPRHLRVVERKQKPERLDSRDFWISKDD